MRNLFHLPTRLTRCELRLNHRFKRSWAIKHSCRHLHSPVDYYNWCYTTAQAIRFRSALVGAPFAPLGCSTCPSSRHRCSMRPTPMARGVNSVESSPCIHQNYSGVFMSFQVFLHRGPLPLMVCTEPSRAGTG